MYAQYCRVSQCLKKMKFFNIFKIRQALLSFKAPTQLNFRRSLQKSQAEIILCANLLQCTVKKLWYIESPTPFLPMIVTWSHYESSPLLPRIVTCLRHKSPPFPPRIITWSCHKSSPLPLRIVTWSWRHESSPFLPRIVTCSCHEFPPPFLPRIITWSCHQSPPPILVWGRGGAALVIMGLKWAVAETGGRGGWNIR